MCDVESVRPPLIVTRNGRNSGSGVSLDDLSNDTDRSSGVKKREIFAWLLISIQACALAFTAQSKAPQFPSSSIDSHGKIPNPLSINNKPPAFHEQKLLAATDPTKPSSTSFFDPPTFYPPNSGLVSRVWHSNGSPDINSGLQKGSCWCSGDDYCMCTPSLAIDLVLSSGPDHVWLVRRADKGLMALMGGFNEIGETVEEASRRELKEEMNIELPGQPLTLFGVYSDPKRDSRKHAVSVVFHMDIPPHIEPSAGDDAREVVRTPLAEIENLDMFIDHKTILRDYIKMRERQQAIQLHGGHHVSQIPHTGDGEPFKRSVCELPIK